jgi:hypothetical protein
VEFRRMRYLVIILPVVAFVVPGVLFLVGLCKAAARHVPPPGNAASAPKPALRVRPVGKSGAAGYGAVMRDQLGRADYN